MKKAVSMIILMVLIFCAGCSTNKTPLTLEEFTDIVRAEGFEVIDTKEYYDTSLVEQARSALGDLFAVEFIIAPTEANANRLFNEFKNEADLSKGSTSSHSSVGIGNIASYKLNTAGTYFVMSRIDNTVIYIETESDNKNAVDDIVKKLGY
jgi:hypothetical protein